MRDPRSFVDFFFFRASEARFYGSFSNSLIYRQDVAGTCTRTRGITLCLCVITEWRDEVREEKRERTGIEKKKSKKRRAEADEK